MLDSILHPPDGEELSLLNSLWDYFVEPAAKASKDVADGRSLPEGCSTAIFFGPPGTAKTELAKEIARFLGWPLLVLDPSYLVRRGMDMIQAEANVIFGMFETAESIVVLLDEFDEMVRDRSIAGTEALSRLMTTAMLPKLSRIHDRRTVVFIVATNYIDRFDVAISRLGRFDKVFQTLPPTTQEKLDKGWPEVRSALEKLPVSVEPLDEKLGALTFLEFRRLAPLLLKAGKAQDAIELIDHAFENCTMRKGGEQSEEGAWLDRNDKQRQYIVL
jgi:AAA+ superfamily predicted ATPase